MDNILVAVDLNANAKLLVEKAAELAEKFGSKVWVLHVADPEPDFVGNKVGPQYIRDLRADELLKEHHMIQKYIEYLKAKAINADGLLIAGATIQTILEEIEKLQVNLVIIGHYQHSLMYKIFTGSTDTSVVSKSKVPVLIVPI